MSGYLNNLNNLFTNTASKLGSIKQNFIPSENDGDTEDDTHICRVLRGYYTEKGRQFPGWLPPDPRAPVQVIQQPVYTQSSAGGRGYGGLPQGGNGGAGGGQQFGSLWDAQPQQQNQQEPQSLRNQGRVPVQSRRNPFATQQQPQEQVQARPLPSQRAGSMQQGGGNSPFARPDSSGSALSAKDRLKGQFGQKRSASPVVNSEQGAGYRSESYGSSRSGGNSQAAAYPPDNYGGGGGGGYDRGGNGGSGAGVRPYVSATAPWSSGDQEFGGYEPAYDTRNNDRRQQGLPSGGPRGGRGGLPSGPRGPRY